MVVLIDLFCGKWCAANFCGVDKMQENAIQNLENHQGDPDGCLEYFRNVYKINKINITMLGDMMR